MTEKGPPMVQLSIYLLNYVANKSFFTDTDF